MQENTLAVSPTIDVESVVLLLAEARCWLDPALLEPSILDFLVFLVAANKVIDLDQAACLVLPVHTPNEEYILDRGNERVVLQRMPIKQLGPRFDDVSNHFTQHEHRRHILSTHHLNCLGQERAHIDR